jgi:hypothetical protein
MAVKIPKSQLVPLPKLATMDAATRTQLVHAMQSATAVLDPDHLLRQLTATTKLEPTSLESIIRMLTSMYRAANGDPKTFAAEAADATKRVFESESIDWAAFGRDLAALLACDDSLGLTAKTWSVRLEYPNVFCSDRILTDIRPVFGRDAAQPPLAAAIIHTLRITHHAAESHEDFYVTLDAADLRKLRDQVDRAFEKESSLKAFVETTQIKYLEVS